MKKKNRVFVESDLIYLPQVSNLKNNLINKMCLVWKLLFFGGRQCLSSTRKGCVIHQALFEDQHNNYSKTEKAEQSIDISYFVQSYYKF